MRNKNIVIHLTSWNESILIVIYEIWEELFHAIDHAFRSTFIDNVA